MGVPGADDVMLNYQSTSFHDALYLRVYSGFGQRRNSKPGSRSASGVPRIAGLLLEAGL